MGDAGWCDLGWIERRHDYVKHWVQSERDLVYSGHLGRDQAEHSIKPYRQSDFNRHHKLRGAEHGWVGGVGVVDVGAEFGLAALDCLGVSDGDTYTDSAPTGGSVLG